MTFTVIDNPTYSQSKSKAGFKNHEFKKLAGLYSQGASQKVFYDMAVDVDFEDGVCQVTYYHSNAYKPALQFIVRQVGPRTMMYEIWKEGKGRIFKSGLFDKAYERLETEYQLLADQT